MSHVTNSVLLRLVIFLVHTFTYQLSGAFDWHYGGKIGAHNWHTLYEICAAGTHQSPIDIITNDTVYDPNLKEFVIWYNPTHLKGGMTVFNNGKTVKIKTDGRFYVANGGLKNLYKTDHVHLHWGKENHLGSEHFIDSKAFAMELHIVNFDIKRFPDIETAASEPLGLAVLGVMFDVSDTDNPELNMIINNLETMQLPGHPKVDLEAQSVRSLLPRDISRYYRYNGSLTTPACYESVIWTIFEQHNLISHKQITKLRNLFYVYDATKEKRDLKKTDKIENTNHTETTNSSSPGNPTGNTTKSVENGTSAPENLVLDPFKNNGTISEEKNKTKLDDEEEETEWIKKYRFEMVNNFRPVQKLNDRKVLRSFKTLKQYRISVTVVKDTASNYAIISPWVTFLLLVLYLCALE